MAIACRRLTPTTDDRLRRHLAAAISECCNYHHNRVAFGDADAVAPLVKYLRSDDAAVHQVRYSGCLES